MALENLGRAMTVEEVAERFNIAKSTVTKYADRLGGVRIGRTIRFFESPLLELIRAIQERSEMGGPSPTKWGNPAKGVSNQAGVQSLGGRAKKGRLDDPFNVLSGLGK